MQSEIVIVGAGPVGLTTAALLATGLVAERVNIRVIDAGSKPQWSPSMTDLRVYAVSQAAQAVLARAGALQGISRRRISAYEHMRVWEGLTMSSAAQLSFDSAQTGESSLGHIIEDSLMRFVLFDSLQQFSNVEITFATQLESIDFDARRVRINVTGDADATDSTPGDRCRWCPVPGPHCGTIGKC